MTPEIPSEDRKLDRESRLERRLAREKAARKQAEALIEEVSRKLWHANKALEEANTELRRLSAQDVLTGLGNRRALINWMESSQRHTLRTGNLVGVISIDIDRFKEINDSFGHDAGDAFLQEIAERVLTVVREEDLVVRMGGDELLVVLEGVHNTEDTLMVAEKIHEMIGQDLTLSGSKVTPSASIGVSVLERGGDIEAAFRLADKALYAAKRTGRGRIVVLHTDSNPY